MVADFYTKPLQRSLFRKMRDFIMGYTTSLNKVRVENIPFSDNNETRLTDKCDSKEVTPAQNFRNYVTSTSHKLSYADIVKGKNDMNLDDSSHSFKLIQ
jgi:hypothetical protein